MKNPQKPSVEYDASCRSCARLAVHLDEVKLIHPQYHCAPVAPFGANRVGLLIVGLAPGTHGANRTGRPFTGDHAGILLYATLHKFGFANHAGSADPLDGLCLKNCRVTNAVKCLPPANKPLPAEIRACNHFLASEIAACAPRAVLALGRIAHDAVLLAAGLRPVSHPFGHAKQHSIDAFGRPWVLIDSYHCSRYNTQTRRLTTPMFESVVLAAKSHLDAGQ